MLRQVLLALVCVVSVSANAASRVTLLHFSDYHSHALPFYTERGERGGIARALAYLVAEKRHGALVFSGGDMINKGSPAWSDKFQCAEWPWLNNIVDAMAFGNHDADYGFAAFEKCRGTIRYPVLSANTKGFKPYLVIDARGARIGVFAIAGPDFPQLVKVPELEFSDPVAAARETVRNLRDKERVDAVVMIGHEHAEADYALARAVPGIDVIFGTHSHLERDLIRIPETSTWFISPGQYLELVSRVVLVVEDRKVKSVEGGLVAIDDSLRENKSAAGRVKVMQKELENDPQYRDLFVPIARLDKPIGVEALAQRALEVMRSVTKADIALSTHSTFRHPLAAGPLTMEALRAALPYDNEIVVCTMPGSQLLRAADAEMYVSAPIDPKRTYRVATTDYVAFTAYKDVFACEKERTGKRVRAELKATLSP